MMRQEFLEKLGNYLNDASYAEVEDAKRYYDELILDAVESGRDEAEFIASLGIMDEIASQIKTKITVNEAVRKPGMKNWAKAAIALLSICATPIALPLIILVVALAITVLILVIAAAVTIGALIISGVFTAFWLLFTVPLSFGSIGFAIGLTGIALLIGLLGYYMVIGTLKMFGIATKKAYSAVTNRKKAAAKKGGAA